MKFGHIGVLIAVFAMAGCSPKSPEESAGGSSPVLQHDFTLSQAEFDSLTPETQFMVANKALSTMYRGLPADEFFDLSKGLEDPQVQYTNFVSDTQIKLQELITHDEFVDLSARLFGVEDNLETTDVDESIPARFFIDSGHPHQYYMARIQGYPLSRDMFVNWMSYFLANTIMFSPAREMDSTDNQDVAWVLGYLDTELRLNTPIREVVKGWLHRLTRWRVSRSPENHALEMFELYLGVFNDTPEEQQNTLNGGKVCDYWSLSDDDENYVLKSDPIKPEGTQTLKVFGQYVSTCHELYDVVSGHPLLIPRVVEVIVNYFLDGSPAELKTELIQNIVSTGPTTFDDVFLAIIYSEAFLLQAERPKTIEENAFGFLNSMHWTPRSDRYPLDERVLDVMLDSSNNSEELSVHNMGWAAMDYKIGRTPFLPMDVLSFASYHRAMRQEVLLNGNAYSGCYHPGVEYRTCYQQRSDEELAIAETDPTRLEPFPIHNGAFYVAGTENLKPELENLSAEEFVDFIFISALGRKAEAAEKTALLEEANEDNRDYVRADEDGVLQLRKTNGEDLLWENRTDDFAMVILDYISRLPEFYYYKAAN